MSDLKHLFVPYELAVKLKEKEFNEPCIAYYHEDNKTNLFNISHNQFSDEFSTVNNNSSHLICSPLYQQVVDWFREKYKLHIEIDEEDLEGNDSIHRYEYAYRIFKQAKCVSKFPNIRSYSDYYYTLNKAVEEALNLI